jgi:hypothetical protein
LFIIPPSTQHLFSLYRRKEEIKLYHRKEENIWRVEKQPQKELSPFLILNQGVKFVSSADNM